MRVCGCRVMCLRVWFVIDRVMVDGLFVCVCIVRCVRVSFFKMCLCVLWISYKLMLSVCFVMVFECCLRVCVCVLM